MTYYTKFDSSIQCEEGIEVSPEEQAEIFQMIADEYQAHQSYGDWSDEDQRLWEAEQERLKGWTHNYSPNVDGDSYAGIAI